MLSSTMNNKWSRGAMDVISTRVHCSDEYVDASSAQVLVVLPYVTAKERFQYVVISDVKFVDNKIVVTGHNRWHLEEDKDKVFHITSFRVKGFNADRRPDLAPHLTRMQKEIETRVNEDSNHFPDLFVTLQPHAKPHYNWESMEDALIDAIQTGGVQVDKPEQFIDHESLMELPDSETVKLTGEVITKNIKRHRGLEFHPAWWLEDRTKIKGIYVRKPEIPAVFRYDCNSASLQLDMNICQYNIGEVHRTFGPKKDKLAK